MAKARIRQLDEATANQIAAGEVVERPASVVKELLENAVDAEARRVVLEVEEGGVERIRVTDDGHGMPPDDVRLSLSRHATSKITGAHDLVGVRTMGFRGEALPSIASVSRFTLTSRPPDADEGFRVHVEGGVVRSERSVGTAPGTTVDVEDLFFNVPARRKFLKRAATELGHISDAVVRLALARPDVAFRLKHGRKVLLDVPPASEGDPRGRLARILGDKVADALHPITEGPAVGDVRVTGYAAAPGLTERTTRGQYVFVNGRFVRDRTIQHAIQDGYRTLMEKGRHPVVVLHLSVDPESFDVNVHPQKTEVRFAQTGQIHRAVTSALQRTLLAQPWLQSGRYAVALARGTDDGARPTTIRDGGDKGLSGFVGVREIPLPAKDGQRPPFGGGGSRRLAADRAFAPPPSGRDFVPPPSDRNFVPPSDRDFVPPPSDRDFAPPSDRDFVPPSDRDFVPPPTDRDFVPPPTDRDYVPPSDRDFVPPATESDVAGARVPHDSARAVASGPTGHLFEDSHSASKAGRFASLQPVGQVLGTYLVCQGPEEMVVIDQHAAHERIAFQRMRTQQQARSVASQPLLMPLPIELDEGRAATADLHNERLVELGFDLAHFGGTTWMIKATPVALKGADAARLIRDLLDELASFEQTTPYEEQVDALLSCAACHSVVRAGDRLSNEEIRALLVQMDEIDFGAHCPHGRPVFVRWSSDELARLFHRT